MAGQRFDVDSRGESITRIRLETRRTAPRFLRGRPPMKQETELKTGARAYVGAVLLLGAVVATFLLTRSDPARWDWHPIAIFTVLGLLSTAVSVTYRGFRASVTVHQIGTSFAYALFLLVDPAAVGLSLALVSVADWLVNRRRILPGLFNIAQLWISVGAA